MHTIYLFIGFVVFWAAMIALVGTIIYVLTYVVLYMNRARKMVDRFGHNNRFGRFTYLIAVCEQFLNSFGDGPESTSYNGLYFPFFGEPHYGRSYNDIGWD